MKTTKNPRVVAFTLIEMMIVVAIVGLLAVIGVTNYMIARDSTRVKIIHSNLREIDNAKVQWALDNKKGDGAVIPDVSEINDYLRSGIHDVIHEIYTPNPIGEAPTAALPAGVKLGPYGPGAIIPAP